MPTAREARPRYGGQSARSGTASGRRAAENQIAHSSPTRPQVLEIAPRLRESQLFEIWRDQSFPGESLRTRDGATIRVIYRGLPGLGPGPDFRDAIIALPDGPAHGDVELHVRASDFRKHGHHLDSAYCGVVLHLVYIDDAGPGTVLADGRSVPVAVLPATPRSTGRIAYAEPCRTAVDRMGGEAASATLDKLGLMRFRQKAAAWAKRLAAGAEPEQALWSGLLEALGYGGERDGLRRIAEAVPWRRLAAAIRAAAEDKDSAARELRAAWLLAQPNALWRAGLRPGNRPERRLEGAASLAARFVERGGLAAALLAPLDEDGSPETVIAALTVPGLIGRARAIEVAGNAVLPLAAALCGEPGARRYEALLTRLPLPARYGAVRHLHEAAAGAAPVNMQRQQGMLYLLRQYCSRGGCGKCPLS